MYSGKSIVLKKSYEFAVQVVKMVKKISKNQKEYVISKQFFRSGTSICANINEAMGGSSRKDFIHKMNISYKEVLETKYWLNLMKDCDYINSTEFDNLHHDAEELSKIIYSIIRTSKSVK